VVLTCAVLGRLQGGKPNVKMPEDEDQQEVQSPLGERLARSTTLLPVATVMSLQDRLHIKTGVCMRWLCFLVFGLGGRRANGCASCLLWQA
jgi:hypothetical protein